MTFLASSLVIEDVSAGYNGETIISGVSFTLPVGESLAVVGPNGAGKSTMFKVLVGLLPLRSGRILVHEQPLGSHIDCVAYIPQRSAIDLQFPVNVLDTVVMGRFGKMRWLQTPSKEDREIALQNLERMGIASQAKKSLADLSGGQLQRVFLARALAQEPHILLLDEPFIGVDAATQETTLSLLAELQEQGIISMVSTHDLSMAATRFDQVMLINRKVIAMGPASQVFTAENISATFGGQMLNMDGLLVVDDCSPLGDKGLRS